MTYEIGALIAEWARLNPKVAALVQFGSRQRAASQLGAPDSGSDWDFQVILSGTDPRFASEVSAGLGLKPIVVVERGGRLGSADKITWVFEQGVLDVVVIPLPKMEKALCALKDGSYREIPEIRASLSDLAAVLRNGFRIIKEHPIVDELYPLVVASFSEAVLDEPAIDVLANGFICDYLSTRSKIYRGEYIAAQRWLHSTLIETNLRLAHELRRRDRLQSFPDGRRIEFCYDQSLIELLRVSAAPCRESLFAAIEQVAAAFREMMSKLSGGQWKWPTSLPTPSLLTSENLTQRTGIGPRE